uniref:Prolyl 4-hydroxylase alpha subunit Fe(2+) 2OG dioxygenase domain-containing protein n=1 Tax=Pyramimonas obovata TaxID=1411642 RepID=A0A7S0R420_9CHLO
MIGTIRPSEPLATSAPRRSMLRAQRFWSVVLFCAFVTAEGLQQTESRGAVPTWHPRRRRSGSEKDVGRSPTEGEGDEGSMDRKAARFVESLASRSSRSTSGVSRKRVKRREEEEEEEGIVDNRESSKVQPRRQRAARDDAEDSEEGDDEERSRGRKAGIRRSSSSQPNQSAQSSQSSVPPSPAVTVEKDMAKIAERWRKYKRNYRHESLCGPRSRDLTKCPLNVFQDVYPVDVIMEPYPHIVKKNVLPKEIYDELVANFPSDAYLGQLATGRRDRGLKSNYRFDVSGAQTMLTRMKVDPMWVDFVEFHTSPAFYKEVLRVFGDALLEERPDFGKVKGKRKALRDMYVKLRRSEDNRTDLTLDCQIAMNSPVTKDVVSVRGPHVDDINELWAGLLYLRHPADNSTGGELNVYECEEACEQVRITDEEKAALGMSTRRNHEQFHTKDLKVVSTVPYAKNTMVFFINSDHSVHGVSPRGRTPFSRRLVNFVGQKVIEADIAKAKDSKFAPLVASLPAKKALTSRLRSNKPSTQAQEDKKSSDSQ